MIRLGWFLEIIPPLWSGSRSVCPPACWAAPGHSPPFICLPETWNGLLVLLWCNNPKRLRWNLSAEFSSSHLRFLCSIFFFLFNWTSSLNIHVQLQVHMWWFGGLQNQLETLSGKKHQSISMVLEREDKPVWRHFMFFCCCCFIDYVAIGCDCVGTELNYFPKLPKGSVDWKKSPDPTSTRQWVKKKKEDVTFQSWVNYSSKYHLVCQRPSSDPADVRVRSFWPDWNWLVFEKRPLMAILYWNQVKSWCPFFLQPPFLH